MNRCIGLHSPALPDEVASFDQVANGVGYPDLTGGLHGPAFGRRQLPGEAGLEGFDAQRVGQIFCPQLPDGKLCMQLQECDQAQ